jgi:predicted RNase H-like HicB family nuclease
MEQATVKYLIIYESNETNFSAYSPDIPGVGVTGATFEEAQKLIHEAIEWHLEWLREDGIPLPQPARSEYHEIAA